MSRSSETAKSVLIGSSIIGKKKRHLLVVNAVELIWSKIGLAGATTGATIAVLKNAPVKQYTVSTGLNCGVFGATFFCK